MERKTESTACPSCGAALDENFCAACGERRPDPARWSLRVMLLDSVHTVFDTDNRLLRSFRLLLFRPGFLTLEYRRGCRRPYTSAFRMMLLVNILYFFVQPFTWANTFNTNLASHMDRQFYSPIAETLVERRVDPAGPDYTAYVERFNRISDHLARSLIIVLCPFMAIALALLNRRSGRYFVEHLHLSLNFFAFNLLVVHIFTFLLVGWLRHWLNSLGLAYQYVINELTMSCIMFGLGGAWLALALRRLHGQSRLKTGLKTAAFILYFFVGIHLYRGLLFLIAWLVV